MINYLYMYFYLYKLFIKLNYDPTTAILGSWIYCYKPTSLSSSTTLINFLKFPNKGVSKIFSDFY